MPGSIELFAAMDLQTGRDRVALDGEWEFSYDPDDVGLRDRWFESANFAETAVVPGCAQALDHSSARMTTADYDAVRVKANALDMRWPVLAPAWYRRSFQVPGDWRGREVWLHLGGIMPAADLWLNGVHLGYTRSSRTPVRCNLTPVIRIGAANMLALRLAWPEGIALEGCFDFCTPFSGLYRSAWVEAAAPDHIREVWVRTAGINPPAIAIETLFDSPPLPSARLGIEVRDAAGVLRWTAEHAACVDADGVCRIPLAMPGAELWHPDAPALYTARVFLRNDGRAKDRAETRFGVRELRRDGDRILLNGIPIYLRGGCDDQDYPETICPPASREYYIRRLRAMKACGFNYTKSCHEVFTGEHLDAADEVGVMVCQEMPFGLTQRRWTPEKCGRELDPEEADFLRREFAAIVRSRRNHPSIAIGATVGEINFSWMSDSIYRFLTHELPSSWRSLHPGVLVLDISGAGGEWRSATARGPRSTDVVEECPGDSTRQEPLFHPLEPTATMDRPGLYHEYNWIAGLPEPGLKSRYAGLPTFPSGVAALERAAAESGLGGQVPLFVDRARKLKRFLQKEALAAARRNPRITGYHFWLVHGFSWCQEGALNEFWDLPDDMKAEEFRAWNSDVVILLDDNNRRCFPAGRRAALGLQVSNFGQYQLAAPALLWQLRTENKVVAEGLLSPPPIATGTLSAAWPIDLHLPAAEMPAQYEFHVHLKDGENQVAWNRWDLWAVPGMKSGPWIESIVTDLPAVAKAVSGIRLYPPGACPEGRVVVTDRITPPLLDMLEKGGRVVAFPGALRDYRPGSEFRPGQIHPDDWANSFSNLYRSPPWAIGRTGNFGTVMRDHPVLDRFPHDGWCQAPFVPLIHGAYPICLAWYLPDKIDPIIRAIGHPETMADNAYMFEVGVGGGAVLATSLQFTADAAWQDQPQTAYLLSALLAYAASDEFRPGLTISRSAFERGLANQADHQL